MRWQRDPFESDDLAVLGGLIYGALLSGPGYGSRTLSLSAVEDGLYEEPILHIT